MNEKFKIGFIGYGRRGKGMLKTIASLPDVEVAAVCDLRDQVRSPPLSRSQNSTALS